MLTASTQATMAEKSKAARVILKMEPSFQLHSPLFFHIPSLWKKNKYTSLYFISEIRCEIKLFCTLVKFFSPLYHRKDWLEAGTSLTKKTCQWNDNSSFGTTSCFVLFLIHCTCSTFSSCQWRAYWTRTEKLNSIFWWYFYWPCYSPHLSMYFCSYSCSSSLAKLVWKTRMLSKIHYFHIQGIKCHVKKAVLF